LSGHQSAKATANTEILSWAQNDEAFCDEVFSRAFPARAELEGGGKGFAQIGGEAGERGEVFGKSGFEDAFDLCGYFGSLLVAEHAKRAGEFVGDGDGFVAGG